MKTHIRFQKHYHLLFIVLFVCVGGGITSCKKANTLSYNELRMRYFYTLVPPNVDVSDAIINQRVASLDSVAKVYWESMEKSLDRDFLWESNKRTEYIPGTIPHGSVSSKVSNSFGRLGHLATVYQTATSVYYNNQQLRKDILDGIDWLLANEYNSNVKWYDNWWDWVIGVPMTFNNLLVLMYDDLSKEQLDKAIEALNFFAPNVTYEGASTGANKIWQCKNMILRGIIAQNPQQIKMGVEGLDTEFKYVTTHDGFYKDGSFVQHQWHAYTGGYGRSMLRELTDIIVIVQGSDWEVAKEQQHMIYEWIHNSFAPLIYRAAIMDMVRGREASRSESDRGAGHSLLVSFIRLSIIAPEDEKQYLKSFIKENVQADKYRDFLNDVPTHLLAYTRQLLVDSSITPLKEQSYTKIFAAMDRVVHVRPDFAFALSLSSSRIEDYETINGENLKGWYTNAGMTYLYDNDLRQYSDCYNPTVNVYRIPGTTVDTRPRKAESLPFGKDILYADGYKSPKDWVGGSSICNSYGMVGMWYDAPECSLEAKKSWFMVGDEIVALGAGINSNDNRTIETIVDNRKLNNNSSYLFTANDKTILPKAEHIEMECNWVCFENIGDSSNIGYYFPSKTSLNLQREVRSGSWHDINLPYSSPSFEREYFTLWIDHGKSPEKATYFYVLLPGRNAVTTREYAEHPNIEILSNTPQVQAVFSPQEGVTGLNFWEASLQPIAGVTVDKPASVLSKETAGEMILGISDPTRLSTSLTLTLNRNFSGIKIENPDIKVVSLSPLKLEINVSESLGRTHSITLII
ncbi:MAG: polysaccharide lyase 8 family protein [Mediterranea sp.]|jgi:hyaluronate lyase|nr:polysaccharide lyase 8 family protein [Mediterranea sp.]